MSNVFQNENRELGNCLKEVRASSIRAALVVQARNKLCAEVSLKDEEIETIASHHDCLQHEMVLFLLREMVCWGIGIDCSLQDHLKATLRCRARVLQQKELELSLAEQHEWKRRCSLHEVACSAQTEGHERSTQTEKRQKVMLSRDQLIAAPVLVGLQRTFDAPLLVEIDPDRQPRYQHSTNHGKLQTLPS